MASRVCASAVLVVAIVALVAVAARADEAPPKAEVEKARQAYTDGEAAYRLGRFEEAARRYEEAYRLIKFPAILFDIGQAYRRWYETDKDLDHLRRAQDMYRAFLRDAPTGRYRPAAERFVGEIAKTLAAENRRHRDELIAKAAGRDGLFLADQLFSEDAAEDAALVIDRVLAGRGNPREVIVAGLEKRGVVAGALGRRELAVDAFRRALALDPGYVLPDGAGAATEEAYAAAKASLGGARPLAVTHVPPGELRPGRATPLAVTVQVESDPAEMIEEVAVRYRRAGGGAFLTARATKSAPRPELPAAFLRGLPAGARVEYYVVALDGGDGELAQQGSAREPFVLTVAAPAEVLRLGHPPPSPPPRPWYRRWYLWTAGGAALVGAAGAVGIYYGTRPPPDTTPAVTVPTQP